MNKFFGALLAALLITPKAIADKWAPGANALSNQYQDDFRINVDLALPNPPSWTVNVKVVGPVTLFELNTTGKFDVGYQYDFSYSIGEGIDVGSDGLSDPQLLSRADLDFSAGAWLKIQGPGVHLDFWSLEPVELDLLALLGVQSNIDLEYESPTLDFSLPFLSDRTNVALPVIPFSLGLYEGKNSKGDYEPTIDFNLGRYIGRAVDAKIGFAPGINGDVAIGLDRIRYFDQSNIIGDQLGIEQGVDLMGREGTSVVVSSRDYHFGLDPTVQAGVALHAEVGFLGFNVSTYFQKSGKEHLFAETLDCTHSLVDRFCTNDTKVVPLPALKARYSTSYQVPAEPASDDGTPPPTTNKPTAELVLSGSDFVQGQIVSATVLADDNEGRRITDYEWALIDPTGRSQPANSSTRNFSFSAKDEGTYVLRARAYNGARWSDWTSENVSVRRKSAPPSPRNSRPRGVAEDFEPEDYVVGNEYRVKVRGYDSDENLSHVDWRALPADSVELFESRDTFNKGTNDTESVRFRFRNDNGGERIHIEATIFDTEGASSFSPVVFKMLARVSHEPAVIDPKVFDRTSTERYQDGEGLTKVELGETSFEVSLTDLDDNLDTATWSVNGSFADSHTVSANKTYDFEHTFLNEGLHTVSIQAVDDEANEVNHTWQLLVSKASSSTKPEVSLSLDADELPYELYRAHRPYWFRASAIDADADLLELKIFVKDELVYQEEDGDGDDVLRETIPIFFKEPGLNTIRVEAKDLGNQITSEEWIYDVLPADDSRGAAPVIEAFFPSSNTLYVEPTRSFRVGGIISDPDYDLYQLRVYFNGNLLTEESYKFDREPYNFDFAIDSEDLTGTQTGNHSLSFVAVDLAGNESTPVTKTLSITNTKGHKPSIRRSLPAEEMLVVKKDTKIEIIALVDDPDGDLDVVVFDWGGVDAEDLDDDSHVGRYFDVGTASFLASRSGTITATVFDDTGQSSSTTWRVQVQESLPTEADKPRVIARKGEIPMNGENVIMPWTRYQQSYEFALDVFDNGDDLGEILFQSPDEEWTWTRTGQNEYAKSFFSEGEDTSVSSFEYGDNGLVRGETYNYQVRVTDTQGLVSTHSFSITQGPVGKYNHAPIVQNDSFTAYAGETTSFVVDIVDEEGDRPKMSPINLPAEHSLILGDSRGELIYEPPEGFLGSLDVRLQWDDGYGGVSENLITIRVENPPTPPTLSSSNLNVTVSDSVSEFELGAWLRNNVVSPWDNLEFVVTDAGDIAISGDTATAGYIINASLIINDELGGKSLSGFVQDPQGRQSQSVTFVFTSLASELDSDSDGFVDADDVCPETYDPNQADFDSNGIGDFCEDSDLDGIPDGWELLFGLNPLKRSDGSLDPDEDGLTNKEEYELGNHPQVADRSKPLLVDIDGNNFVDVLLRDEVSGEWFVHLLQNSGIRSSGRVWLPKGHGWKLEGMADVNTDGRADALIRNKADWSLIQLDGRKILERSTMNFRGNKKWGIQYFGDVNGDRSADLILRNNVTGRFIVYLLSSDDVIDTKWLPQNWPIQWITVGFADISGDTTIDIVLRNIFTGEMRAILLQPDMTATNRNLGISVTEGSEVLAVRDFNGDQRADILVRSNTGEWQLYLLDSEGVQKSKTIDLTNNRNWRLMDIRDFTGDGKNDLILRHAKKGTWQVAHLDEALVIEKSRPALPKSLQWSYIGSLDFNGDGTSDVLARHNGTGKWRAFQFEDGNIDKKVWLKMKSNRRWKVVRGSE